MSVPIIYDIQNRFPDRIRRIVDDVASSFNAKAEVDYTIGSLSCINHPALSKIAKAGITKLYGEDVVINFEKIMGGDRFCISYSNSSWNNCFFRGR